MERCGGNRKLEADAQMMLADSRRKIDYIRMQQLQLRNVKPRVPDEDGNYYRSYVLFHVNYYSVIRIWNDGIISLGFSL